MFAISICLATFLNGTILVQFFLYWDKSKKSPAKKQVKEKKNK